MPESPALDPEQAAALGILAELQANPMQHGPISAVAARIMLPRGLR